MSGKKTKSKLSQKKLSVIIIAGIVVSVAIIGIIFLTQASTQITSAFYARDIDTAANSCEDKITGKFGKNLLNKTYDGFSSRYDANRHQYVIWYRVTTRYKDDDGVFIVKDQMAKCTVWEVLGYVSDFSIYQI